MVLQVIVVVVRPDNQSPGCHFGKTVDTPPAKSLIPVIVLKPCLEPRNGRLSMSITLSGRTVLDSQAPDVPILVPVLHELEAQNHLVRALSKQSIVILVVFRH